MKNIEIKTTDAPSKITKDMLHGPVIEVLSIADMMRRLEKNKFSQAQIRDLWVVHDAVVDHERRDTVSRAEALVLLDAMMRKMPVVVAHTNEVSIEYTMLALRADSKHNGFIWCSVDLPFDTNKPCDTCIADEGGLAELIYKIEDAVNIA